MKRRNELARKEHFGFEDLVEIVRILRDPDGCPWDRAQGHKDLRNNLVEEAYEACEGIDTEDPRILQEELGDLLLQVVFHADIAHREGTFGMQEIVDGICRKMIGRHPQIFSNNAEATLTWEELKAKEKGAETISDVLGQISTALPSPTRAQKILKKGKGAIREPEPLDEKDRLGKDFLTLCRKANENGLDAEECLNRYLNRILTNCTETP